MMCHYILGVTVCWEALPWKRQIRIRAFMLYFYGSFYYVVPYFEKEEAVGGVNIHFGKH